MIKLSNSESVISNLFADLQNVTSRKKHNDNRCNSLTYVIAYDENIKRSNAAVYEKVSSMDRMKEIWDKVFFSDKSNQY